MKTIAEYMNAGANEHLVFENVLDNNVDTLCECYMGIYKEMVSVNEGFFSNIGKKIANWGNKAATAGENIDKRIDVASDSAKKAIETAKKQAGASWDKVKDAYQSVVLSVDDAINASKDYINGICRQTKLNIDEFEAKLGQIYTNAIAQSKESAEEMKQWVNDKTKGAQKFAAMNTLLAGAIMARNAGISSDLALQILASAGFN